MKTYEEKKRPVRIPRCLSYKDLMYVHCRTASAYECQPQRQTRVLLTVVDDPAPQSRNHLPYPQILSKRISTDSRLLRTTFRNNSPSKNNKNEREYLTQRLLWYCAFSSTSFIVLVINEPNFRLRHAQKFTIIRENKALNIAALKLLKAHLIHAEYTICQWITHIQPLSPNV